MLITIDNKHSQTFLHNIDAYAGNWVLSLVGSSERQQLPLLPVSPALLNTQPLWSSSLLLGSLQESSAALSPSVIVSDGIRPLPAKMVEKIRRWEYTDLSKLITDNNDNQVNSTMVINGQVVAVEPIPRPHRRPAQLDIISWMEAYSKFLVVLVWVDTTSQQEAAGLATHMF